MECVVEYVASLEQIPPAEALGNAALAESHGFDGVFVTDRFQPWLPAHGHASFAWSVLGSMGERTGGALTLSAVPGYRMHPATVAQASVTIASLYPRRHTLVLSAGNAVDEHITGRYWPESHERVARLLESADLIRKLFSTARRGSDTRFDGEYFRLETSRLWNSPEALPEVLLRVGGPVTARRAAQVADGIVVDAGPSERMTALLRAATTGAAESGRDPSALTAAAYVQLAWGRTESDAAEAVLREWPMAGVHFPRGDIRSPFDVAQLARAVGIDDIRARIPVTDDPAVVAAELRRLSALGFRRLFVHNVLRDQRDWIEAFGRRVRPLLQEGTTS